MYARIHNDVVIEILTPVSGFTVEECFHRDLLDACAQVDSDVQVGWLRQEDGTFTPPQPETPAAESVIEEAPAEPVVEAAPEVPTDGA